MLNKGGIMKKLFALVTLLFLSGCSEELPPAPFGLSWDMSESEVAQMPQNNRVRIPEGNGYVVIVPKVDFETENSFYSLTFNDKKLSRIVSMFHSLRKEDAETIFNSYDSLFSKQYGNKSNFEPLPALVKRCLEQKICVEKSFSYSYKDLIVVISLSVHESLYSISISYTRKNYFQKLLKEARQK